MLATNNIFSPANGKPITTPTQDITLGVYYLSISPLYPESARAFRDIHEVLFALDVGHIKIHDAVKIPNPDYGTDTPRGVKDAKFITTTPGRCIFNSIWDKSLGFYNGPVKKKEIGKLIGHAYEYIGHDKTIQLLDSLKTLGYEYATVAGFSTSVADMVVPKTKTELIAKARAEIEVITRQYNSGVLTEGERHNKIVDVWTQTSNQVASDLFAESEANSKKGINPVYAMLDSGARGSKDQIRQLAGMRGLMAKPSGDIIERPILSNFREGLTVLEYFISTHGARKGLADTALKTADSGYMTRKLVDVAQDIICRAEDCGTMKGIIVSAIIEGDDEMLPLKDRLLGRFSAQDIRDPAYEDGRLIVKAGQEFTSEIADRIKACGINRVLIRSVLTCEIEHGVCIKCYGRNLATDKNAEIGDALGIIAAQSIGEPGTQLTMRTFHIGGAAAAAYKQPEIHARTAGTVKLENIRTIEDEKGQILVVNKNGFIVVYDPVKAKKSEEKNRERAKLEAEAIGAFYIQDYDYWTDAVKEAELDRYVVEIGAVLFKKDGDKVKQNEKISEWDPYHLPIIAEEYGVVELTDLIEGMTLNKTTRGGTQEIIVMEHREDLHPQIVIKDSKTHEVISNYSLPAGAFLMVSRGDNVRPGTTLARVPRQQQKTKDITGGLPRVSELFEARTPKEVAEIARIDGFVEFGKMTHGGRRTIIVYDPDTPDKREEHIIPASKHLVVGKGDYVKKGQKLTIGSVVPQMLLQICGAQELQRYLVNEVQTVYRAQGVEINDKHIEIIIRQMMQKILIVDQGDTAFLSGEQVDRYDFMRENIAVRARGGQPAQGEPVLLGITKASLETESFISSASFQDTTRILTDAATLGKVDILHGFKENVITGHLIPAGTGSDKFQNLRVQKLGEELPIEIDVLEQTRKEEEREKSIDEIDFGEDIPESDEVFDEGEFEKEYTGKDVPGKKGSSKRASKVEPEDVEDDDFGNDEELLDELDNMDFEDEE